MLATCKSVPGLSTRLTLASAPVAQGAEVAPRLLNPLGVAQGPSVGADGGGLGGPSFISPVRLFLYETKDTQASAVSPN